MSDLRLFVAIDLPDGIRRHLAQVQRDLRAYNLKARWVAPENIHLTLAFLGDTPEYLVDPISATMSSAAAGMVPFRLGVKGLGVFPSYKRPRVLWAGVSGTVASVTALKKLLDRALEKVDGLDYRPERRAYKPHLTIGRAKGHIAPSVLAEVSRLWDDTARLDFTVGAVHLIQSRLSPQGARYTLLHTACWDQNA